MLDPCKIFSKKPKNTKAGLTIRLNQDENNPFEVTMYFKNPDTDTHNADAVSITASGKLTLSIGEKGSVELFAENTNVLKELENQKEGKDVFNQMSPLRETDAGEENAVQAL